MIEYLRSLNLKDPRILDIGCGSDLYSADLADFGPTTGIDLSPVAIENAKQRFPSTDFRVANLYQMKIEKPFNVILAQEVFDHVDDQPEFLEKCASILVDVGFLKVEFAAQSDATAIKEKAGLGLHNVLVAQKL